MSFDLTVLNPAKPLTAAEALAVHNSICDGEDVSKWLAVDDRTAAFVAALTKDYPQIDELPDDQIDNCPWSCGLDVGPSWAMMNIVWSRSHEIAKFVFALCRQHDLALFDHQTGLVCLPDRVVRTAGILLTCPWLYGQLPASRELLADLVPFLVLKDDPYVILIQSDEVYMQTLWTKDGFLLEFRDGCADQHFRADRYLPMAEAIRTLSDYALKGSEWRSMQSYSRVTV